MPAHRPSLTRRPRRLAATLLVGLIGTVTVACSEDSDKSAASLPVTIVVANTELNFAREISAGFTSGVAEVTSVPAAVAGPKIVDTAREVQIFNQVIEGRTGGVSVMTLGADLFVRPMAAAVERGIPLIMLDNPPLEGSGVKLFIGNDNTALGRMLADQVIAELPPDAAGDIVLGTTSPGTEVLDWRAEGIMAEFKKRLPKVRVLGPFDTKQEVAANLAAWKLLVKANPDALAFLGTGDADGWNLASIRRQEKADWVAGAFDLDPKSLQAVADGDLLLISPEHYAAGAVAGQLQAARAAEGDALPEGWIEIPGLAVTPDNIGQLMARQSTPAGRKTWFSTPVNDILEHLDENLRPMSEIR